MESAYERILTTLSQYIEVSTVIQQTFRQAMKPLRFSKGQFLVQEGESNGTLYYIDQGLVRFVYITDDGREFNKSFAAEGEFVGCLRSILSQQSCRFSIQALEDTQVLALNRQSRELLWNKHSEWERLGRVLAERLALKKEEREAQFLLDSAESRYQFLLEEYPGLCKRIPQYHIASYIGITDVALSRIRKRLSGS